MTDTDQTLPAEVDLLVLGSGAGGMAAALTGALEGLRVLLVEKCEQVGGTTARSAGSLWLPNTHLDRSGDDSRENALTYLRAAVGNGLDEKLAGAFLDAAPEMVRRLERDAGLALRAYPHHPDYLADLPGATLAGRVLEPVPFDAAILGHRFGDIAPPLPEFTIFGGMMVDRTDIGHLMAAGRRPKSFLHAVRLVIRYGRDRLRHARGRRLVMGNALVARLYHALLARGVGVALGTRPERLLSEGGRVRGARLIRNGHAQDVSARAVVLATGGFSRDPELRKSLLPAELSGVSAVAEGATGDGLDLARAAGAGLAEDHASQSFWAPVSHVPRADGTIGVFPHFVLDRGKPGAFAVGPDGRRFVNEATTYHRFGAALLAMKARKGGGRCHLICDHEFIGRYGLGVVRPRRIGLKRAIDSGYVVRAESLAALARLIGVAPEALSETAERHATFAKMGVDADFAKGADDYQRNLGDTTLGPNPCIGALGDPPYYALELHPGDIGASAGLRCDDHARVLGADGAPVPGLYACGADMASIMAGRYPGPGITLGPAMTFGYLAAMDAAALAKRQG